MSYIYSYVSDFSSNWNQRQFHDEIEEENSITPNLVSVNKEDDTITVNFDSSLNSAEQITLNNLVAVHTPDTYIGYNVQNITLIPIDINSTTYMSLGTITFPGTKKWKNITNIKIVGHMEVGGTGFDVRVNDTTNNNIIAIHNCTSTDEIIYDLGTISNLSKKEAIWEIQAKINGSSVAYIRNIHIYYD